MAKRNRKLRNELNELEQSERNLYLIKSKNDNISNRMDGLSLREILPKTQAQSDTFDAYRNYYIKYKREFAKWKMGNIPSWYSENLEKGEYALL